MLTLEKCPAVLQHLNAYTETHGEDKVPATALKLTVVRANTVLDEFERGLRKALYRKADVIAAQQSLDIPRDESTADGITAPALLVHQHGAPDLGAGRGQGGDRERWADRRAPDRPGRCDGRLLPGRLARRRQRRADHAGQVQAHARAVRRALCPAQARRAADRRARRGEGQ